MYTLDGFPLDDPDGRWYLNGNTGLRILPSRLRSGVSLPGRDGTTPSLRSEYGSGSLGISLTVRADTHGAAMRDVELLHGILGQRKRLLPLVHDYGGGETRTAMVEILSGTEQESPIPEHVRLSYVCEVPSVFWRDAATVDSTVPLTAGAATSTLAPMAGSTGTINDALIRFKGGFSTATVTDPVSGDSLTVNAALAATEYLVIDVANWVARKHAADSWSLTGGTNAITSITSNRGSGPMLTLNPDFVSGAGRVQVRASAVNPATSPTVSVRAKRSFL